MWWGKIIGVLMGAAFLGPLGAILGFMVGHLFDKGLELNRYQPFSWGWGGGGGSQQTHVQQIFFRTTFSVMGHIAKSDGRVSEKEIDRARAVMQHLRLNEEQTREAIRYFTEGKNEDFNLSAALDELVNACRHYKVLLQIFVEVQFQAARVDKGLEGNKKRILAEICNRLGVAPVFSRFEFIFGGGGWEGAGAGADKAGYGYQERARAYSRQVPTLEEDYAVLEIPRGATNHEIKRAYRRLMSQNHPDKLIAKGLPEEMVKIATDKTQKIQAAYERIRRAKNMS